MTLGDPFSPARSGHRRQAVAAIEAAFRSGRLTGPDHDLRLAQARTSATIGELDTLTRDLGQPSLGQAPAPVLPSPQLSSHMSASQISQVQMQTPQTRLMPTPQSPFTGPPSTLMPMPQAPTRGGKPGAGLIAFLVMVGILIALGMGASMFVNSIGGDDGSSSSTVSFGPDPVPSVSGPAFALNVGGLQRFENAYRERFGRTVVSSVAYFQDYVVVAVPPRRATGSPQTWVYRDGDFTTGGSTPADLTGRIDLGSIDKAALIVNLRAAARRLHVPRPTDRYALVTPGTGGQDAVVHIAVANQRGDDGFLTTTLSGHVLELHPAR